VEVKVRISQTNSEKEDRKRIGKVERNLRAEEKGRARRAGRITKAQSI
jgi:hypothetical protein